MNVTVAVLLLTWIIRCLGQVVSDCTVVQQTVRLLIGKICLNPNVVYRISHILSFSVGRIWVGLRAGLRSIRSYLFRRILKEENADFRILQVQESKSWMIESPATQDKDSGHRILQENTGNRWNIEAVFWLEIFRIFSGGFLPTSCAFQQEPVGNHRQKSRKFPTGILLPQNYPNYSEPAVSWPDCSTWVVLFSRYSFYGS